MAYSAYNCFMAWYKILAIYPYFRLIIIRLSTHFLTIINRLMGKMKTHNPISCTNMIERRDLILVIHATDYVWQAFRMFSDHRQVCIMMLLRYSNVRTNEYHSIIYHISCAHHKLRIISWLYISWDYSILFTSKSMRSIDVFCNDSH